MILLLGGTAEARELAVLLDHAGVRFVSTLAGRVARPRLPVGEALGAQASGYEIHHGRIARGDDEEFLGGARAGHVFGTMWHGSLESDGLRRAFLAEASAVLGRPFETSDVSFAERRDARLDLLGDLVEQKLDVEALLAMAEHGAPDDLVMLPPGAATVTG